MSVNCTKCGVNKRTGFDLICDECRKSNRRVATPDLHAAISPFILRAADRLAAAVMALVYRGALDARSLPADAVLNYAGCRMNSASANSLNDLCELLVKKYPDDEVVAMLGHRDARNAAELVKGQGGRTAS